MGMQYFHPQVQVAHNQQAPPSQHGAVVSYSSVPHPSSAGPQPTLYTYASAPQARSPQTPSRDESPKHVAGPMYISHGRPIPPGYVLHQAVEVCILNILC